MASGCVTVTLLLSVVVCVVAGNACPANPINWSCSNLPNLVVRFPELPDVKCNEFYAKDLFKTPPDYISFSNSNPQKTYILVMVDPDAPGHSEGGAWLHWIRDNLEGSDLRNGILTNGRDIVPYAPPTPPKGTGTHHYYIFLYEEPAPLKQGDLKRRNFVLSTYATKNELCGPIASNMFTTVY